MLMVGDGQSGKHPLQSNLCWRHFFKNYVEDFEAWNLGKMNGKQTEHVLFYFPWSFMTYNHTHYIINITEQCISPLTW